MKLKDQTCVITGAARGIGFAIAEALSNQGARVVLADVDAAALAAVNLPNSKGIVCDITKAADVERLASEAEVAFGPIAVWVNNAGLARHRWIPDYTEAEIDLMLAVNLKGTILGSQSALRRMIPQKRGHIINIISTASLRGVPSETVYCAAKWGVRGFTPGRQATRAASASKATRVAPWRRAKPKPTSRSCWPSSRPSAWPRTSGREPAHARHRWRSSSRPPRSPTRS